jgi:hypothetical protein
MALIWLLDTVLATQDASSPLNSSIISAVMLAITPKISPFKTIPLVNAP